MKQLFQGIRVYFQRVDVLNSAAVFRGKEKKWPSVETEGLNDCLPYEKTIID